MTVAQAPLFDLGTAPTARKLGDIVNVASVPQRSPFRYPGGKTWLVPHVRRWLTSLDHRPSILVEPFTGGGTVALTTAAEGLVEHVAMVELDDDVAAVWKTIAQGDGPWLANEIATFTLTMQTVRDTLAHTPTTTKERAFLTILRNRVQRGGILAPGAGLVKEGENGKGLHSRWYPNTLRRRILDIDAYRDRIDFTHGDGLAVMRQHAANPRTVFFIDPPYTAGSKSAGSRLYTHSALDHEELFRIAASVQGDFLMTYDDATELHALAAAHGFDTHLARMKNTHHAHMSELLIGRDLAWARS